MNTFSSSDKHDRPTLRAPLAMLGGATAVAVLLGLAALGTAFLHPDVLGLTIAAIAFAGAFMLLVRERLAAERHLLDLRRIETDLRSRLFAFERERDAAEQKALARVRYLVMATHDVRAPANNIALLAELIGRYALDPQKASRVPEAAANLRLASINLIELVSDILELARLDAAQLEVSSDVFSLPELLRAQVTQHEHRAQSRGVRITFESPPADILVTSDKIKLTRSLDILIESAIKYGKNAGVRIDCELGNETGEVSLRVSTGALPGGAGKELFEECVLLDLKDPQGRKGGLLALAICGRLVERLGFRAWVDKGSDASAAFRLLLPASCVVGPESAARGDASAA